MKPRGPRRSLAVRVGARIAVAIAATLALGLDARSAAADPPTIVAPRPLTPLRAEYPTGANGDAEVVLAIVVNADGSVRSARAVSGDEPFVSAAIAASSQWRFEPAMREGKPIVASIKAQIRFTAPAVFEPEPAAPTQAPPSSAPPPPPVPLEVTVHGEVHAPGVQSFTRAEVRLLPGAFGDPFRAIETLPGVTPLASGVPFFYVRGAPPGDVGYFVDGIRVPLLYHIGLGPSVVHPAILDRVDLYAGGYPASYGRYAGGIVAGETKDPAAGFHAEANIRIVDAGAMVEGPLPGDRGSFFVAGRYSYTGALLSLVSSSIDLGYWDYQARVTFHATPRDDVTVFAFGAHDFLGNTDANGPHTLFDTTFHRLDLRYDRRLGGPDDRLRAAVTLGYDQTSFDKGAFVRDRSIATRIELTKRASESVLVRAGVDAQVDVYEANLVAAFGDAPGFTSLFSNRADVAIGAHADAVIQVTNRFEITPGLRVDVFGSHGFVQNAVAIDPRLAARLAITKGVRLITAHGLASQPPSFILPGPGFTRDLTGGLQRSFQSSLGVEADLPWDVSGTFTVFRDAFFNLTDALGTSAVPTNGMTFPVNFDRRSLGSSAGIELMLRRRLTRRLGGVISYTLSRSERIVGLSHVASSFDRTHVINVAGAYDFGRGFKGGTRMLFYTGAPITSLAPSVYYDLRETGRLPPFFRFDVRAEKRWSIASGRGWISLVLEVANAMGAKETLQDQCTLSGCAPVMIGPVTIPSLGLEGGF